MVEPKREGAGRRPRSLSVLGLALGLAASARARRGTVPPTRQLDRRPVVESDETRYRARVALRRPLCSIAMAVACAVLVALAGGSVASPRAKASAPGAGPAHAKARGTAPGRGLASLPASAQSAVSATLGAASRAFAARRSSDGYRLRGGGVAAHLDAGGVCVAGRRRVARDDGCGRRPRRPARAGGRALGRRAREPRLARPRRADGVVRGGAARDRAGIHALPPPGRQGRPAHARAAARRRRARTPGPSGTVLLTRAGRAGLSYGAALGERRERAPAPRGAPAPRAAGS